MDGTDRMRRIALMNQKGGVGKTTTAVNLAAALARLGRPTLVVDLDPQAHATLHLGLDPASLDRTVHDALLDPASAPDTLRTVADNLDLIPAETNLAGAESELANEPDRQRRLDLALRALSTRHDFVFIDCPPALGLLTINGLAAAREVLIPMQAHFLALQGVGKLLETVTLVRQSVNPRLTVTGVILCAHDANTTHAQEVVADLDAFFEQHRDHDVPWRDARVLQPPVRRNIKLAECPSFGQTIFDYAPWAPGALDYQKLAELLAGRLDDPRSEPRTEPGGEPEVESEAEPPTPEVHVASPAPVER